jgi:flagellar hook assembly protein FlgD
MKQATAIGFSLSTPGKVRLTVIDVNGRVVRTLLDDTRGTGNYSVAWDARNDEGRVVVSGVYFYRLEAPGFADTKKLVISD